MRIEVTAEDIANGVRLSACRCPIALAAARAGLFAPEVYPDGGPDEFQPGHQGEIIFGMARAMAMLPPEANRFIHRFDERKPVEPFVFALDGVETAAQPSGGREP